MLGPFRATSPLFGGLLWKIPWRLSRPQKARQRKRLRAVDAVVATVDRALARKSLTNAAAATTDSSSGFAASTSESSASPKARAAEGQSAKTATTLRALERWKAEMPTEREMLPRDKYTMFDRKEKGYRKGVHTTFCMKKVKQE